MGCFGLLVGLIGLGLLFTGGIGPGIGCLVLASIFIGMEG